MRISIWQQFSSNHSGYFWVAGVFKTVEEARTAYDELRHILPEIDRWHREHPEESTAASRSGKIQPLPPEAAVALQYGVKWPQTIDWMEFGGYSQGLIDEAVTIIGRVVTVENPDQTWMTTQPFQGLLERFGAQTIGYDLESLESDAAEDFELHPIVRFTAPDAATADRIEKAIQDYLTSRMILSSDHDLPPWHDDEANFRQVFENSNLLREEDVEVLKKNWLRRYKLFSQPTPSPAGEAMPTQRLAVREGLTMIRNDLKFTLVDVWFYNQELGLSAMFAYLAVNGCTDIGFEYDNQSPDPEK